MREHDAKPPHESRKFSIKDNRKQLLVHGFKKKLNGLDSKID